jgi:hypothetical protein
MTTTVQATDALRAMIDSRLDTIDRILMGRVPRQDRLAIVREVESQIEELLQERSKEELSRDDVLEVLARLDPPEAYLPDDSDVEPASVARTFPTRTARPAAQLDPRVGRTSAGLGVAAIAVLLVMTPLTYFMTTTFQSIAAFCLLGCGSVLLVFGVAVVGLALGILAR